ncbi:hypothetical protein Jiend_49350 [Micromonospora endophytica]|nr:hypothetical protein Jiend_49350 [Micromonospora endophytica]
MRTQPETCHPQCERLGTGERCGAGGCHEAGRLPDEVDGSISGATDIGRRVEGRAPDRATPAALVAERDPPFRFAGAPAATLSPAPVFSG